MAINFTTILPGGDFKTFSIPHNPEDGSLQGRLLLAVDAAGRLEDHFRIVFGGGQKPSVNFSGANISDHPALTSFKFRIEAGRPGEHRLQEKLLLFQVGGPRGHGGSRQNPGQLRARGRRWPPVLRRLGGRQEGQETSGSRSPLVSPGQCGLRLQAHAPSSSRDGQSSPQGRQAGEGHHPRHRAGRLDSLQPHGQ